jgi:hypothetical protein
MMKRVAAAKIASRLEKMRIRQGNVNPLADVSMGCLAHEDVAFAALCSFLIRCDYSISLSHYRRGIQDEMRPAACSWMQMRKRIMPSIKKVDASCYGNVMSATRFVPSLQVSCSGI